MFLSRLYKMTIGRSETNDTYIPLLFIAAVTLLCLTPFIGKAFNIDEPLFIWAARQIHAHPLDFYGFRVNWYGTETSAAEIIKNPPLASYYIALVGSLFGLHEVSLHGAFLLPALAAVAGTYFLAREVSQHPLTATLIGMLTPVFVVSSITVMCDTMMLAFYVWALFMWVRGIRRNSYGDLLGGSLLIAACSLTKYFGISLIPLLLIYTVFEQKRRARAILFLLIPIAILCCYQWGTKALYGRGLLLDAASYANSTKGHGLQDLVPSLISGLSFLGGCFLPIVLLIPLLWGRRTVYIAAIAVPLLGFVLSQLSSPERSDTASWSYYGQLSLFVIAGLLILALAVRHFREKRNSASFLLFLWIAGTFVFSAFVNWSVNGRSLLPIAPAAGVLVACVLGERLNGLQPLSTLKCVAPQLACAWLLSMSVAWSDYGLANTARTAAREIARNFVGKPQQLVFQGHWGFQYYMEQEGATAWDTKQMYPRPFNMVMPENGVGLTPQVMAQGKPLQILALTPAAFISDMNLEMCAGFYSSIFGSLPFAFGKVPDEKYMIVRIE